MPHPMLPLFDAYLFDLDGTVYLGETPLPGAVEALGRLRELGRKVVFVSNNPTKTRARYVSKLRGMGVEVGLDQVVNSSYALARWLTREAPGCRVFVVGEELFKDELSAAGFRLSEDPRQVKFVVSSFDRGFAYSKLQTAFDAIRLGARLVVTNPDRYCPVPGGGEPDCAAMTAAIEACTGVQAELVAGKPSPVMVEVVAELVRVLLQRSVMVGDRLSTDIAMGHAVGMTTVLPLTGETTREMLRCSALQPDFVIGSLLELV